MNHDDVDKAVELIERVFEVHLVGGYLHCQIEDGNLEDCDFEEETLVRRPHNIDYPSHIEMECYHHLKSMAENDRFEAYRRYWDD